MGGGFGNSFKSRNRDEGYRVVLAVVRRTQLALLREASALSLRTIAE
jgi:hypothetical protein